jgi:hypothetical protein
MIYRKESFLKLEIFASLVVKKDRSQQSNKERKKDTKIEGKKERKKH